MLLFFLQHQFYLPVLPNRFNSRFNWSFLLYISLLHRHSFEHNSSPKSCLSSDSLSSLVHWYFIRWSSKVFAILFTGSPLQIVLQYPQNLLLQEFMGSYVLVAHAPSSLNFSICTTEVLFFLLSCLEPRV